MRLFFYVREEVPGLAAEGSYIVVELDEHEYPVTVCVDHGPEALDAIIRHRSRLECVSEEVPSPAVLHAAARLLDGATYQRSGLHVVR